MKKLLPLFFLSSLLLSTESMNAQDFEWAYTAMKYPATKVAAVRKDYDDNFYLATYRDSSSFFLFTELEKRNSNQQLIWSKLLNGDATISDIELNSENHVVAIGYYMDTLTIDGITIINSVSDYSGFIFEMDENGTLQWLHDINPINQIFKPVDLFIAQNGSMYMTSEFAGLVNDFTAFHQLDLQGNIIKSKFNNDNEVRTYTKILADEDGNVYLSGTCGNLATFDTIAANINFSYQNFVIKYDSSFHAQWFHSKEYITFDQNNSLQTDGQSLFWAFVDFTGGSDTVRVINVDPSGNIISNFTGPVAQSFFPGIKFSMDSTGTSVLGLEVFARLFLFRYDPNFNIMWEDTLMTGSSAFPSGTDITSYDSMFYVAGYYYSDTLPIGSFTLMNPNLTGNYPSDVYVAKWKESISTSVSDAIRENDGLMIFPNPVRNNISISSRNNTEQLSSIKIYDAMGRIVYSSINNLNDPIEISELMDGLYFIHAKSEDKVHISRFIKQ